MKRSCVSLVLVASLALAAPSIPSLPSPQEEAHALVVYRNLFGIETIKERLSYPVQPRLDKVFAFTTAEAQVEEINRILQESAELMSADKAFREQVLYEYKAAFSEAELAEYSRWLDSPLGRKIRRFELRNEVLYDEVAARHFKPRIPRLRELLESAEESTRPKRYDGP